MNESSVLELAAENKTQIPSEYRPRKPRASRKLALLKRSGLFSENTLNATITRAKTVEELREAYELVHDVFVEKGFIHPDASGMRLRIFEATFDMATFVAKADGRVVGVISIVGDSEEFGLPSDISFKPELDAMRDAGARLCEVTNQAVATEFRKTALCTELIRCAMAHVMMVGYDETIAAISPCHVGFYELLNFRTVGSERTYSEKIYDPVVALSMGVEQYRKLDPNLDEAECFVHDFMAHKNSFRKEVATWAADARQHFYSANLLRQLFATKSAFLSQCTTRERHILKQKWGSLFDAVVASQVTPVATNWADGLAKLVLGITDSRLKPLEPVYL